MESPGIGVSLVGLLVVVALLLTNAYFVATEFALVAVRRTQVQLWVEEGRRGAVAAAAAIRDLDDAIAATQLGITIASIGLGFVGEPAVARLLQPVFAALGLASAVAPCRRCWNIRWFPPSPPCGWWAAPWALAWDGSRSSILSA